MADEMCETCGFEECICHYSIEEIWAGLTLALRESTMTAAAFDANHPAHERCRKLFAFLPVKREMYGPLWVEG